MTKKKKRLPCFRTKLKLFKLNLKIFVKLILVVRTEEEGSEKKKQKKKTEIAETAEEKFSIIIIIFFCVCQNTHTSRYRMLQPKVGLLLLLRKNQMAATIHLLLCLFLFFLFFLQL